VDRRVKIKLVLVLMGSLLLVVGIASLIGNHYKPSTINPSSNLNEANGPLVFSNTGNLSDILLTQQFTSFYQVISSFIQNQFGQSVTQIKLIGDASVGPNGIITLRLEVEPSQKQFNLTIDRISVYNKLTVSIPAYSYKNTVVVY